MEDISDLAFERTTDAHSGSYAAKFYSNTGTFVANIINVTENEQYELSFWHKGNVNGQLMEAFVVWYNGDTRLKNESIEKVNFTNQWKEEKKLFIVPNGANKLGIRFYVSSGSGYLFLDDVSLVYKGTSGGRPITPPTGIKGERFQREISLSWDKETDQRISWEVFVNNNSVGRSTTNSFIITDLDPLNNYNVKLRAIRGNETSSFTTEESYQTRNFIRGLNEIDRIPHMRTLGLDGECNQKLNLFYNDLANKNAKIQYFIDGQKVMPVGYTLTFPQKGKHKLKVIIEESPNQVWELEYNLNIK